NVRMFQNPVVQDNLRRLQGFGAIVVMPGCGDLACGETGPGRLAELPEIIEAIKSALTVKSLAGKKVLVSAGPTREMIDPVRFISNRSTGKMGFAMAAEAHRRGARVFLVTGPVTTPRPMGVTVVEVTTAVEMRQAVLDLAQDADIVVKAAAVSDYAPAEQYAQKVKKGLVEQNLRLIKNPDILAELGRHKGRRLLIGFAAETEDLLAHAREKMINKNLDLIVANDVSRPGAGFAVDTNIVKLLYPNGRIDDIPLKSKEDVARDIWDRIVELPAQRGPVQ
ncbi:MAG: bifunctional phosphopantothenoylcysteine decarboxylase/phosphopantothenate--cysteine ligase CoaBC, partial [Deltaproteobacteria bacterium]|nr:bifunctional phosphopantothenoylcysteine decarboxylase/phosphopantothenate--cysteine ligase CoaBC [Deltaproteobacteria bacterium]